MKGALLSVAGAAAALLLAACLASWIPCNAGASGGGTIPVYVRTNGVHVDLVLPVAAAGIDWRACADPGDARDAAAAARCPYLSVGWGAKAFYLQVPRWRDLTARVAAQALFGAGGTALHVAYEPEPEAGRDCARLMLDEAQYARLAAFVRASARRGADGRFAPVATRTRYGRRDAFYEGTGRYSPVNTCNTWANRALKAAGQRCCLWTPFASAVFRQVRAGQL